MIDLSPKLLIAAASAFVGLIADECEGDPPDDGTALLYRWGYWSHFDHQTGQSSWPLIETRTADELAAVALARYVLRDAPQVGDIFLQRSPVGRRFVRAGVVAEVSGSGQYSPKVTYHDAMTIEANTDEAGRLGGRRTLCLARRFLPARGDRFTRWSDQDDYIDDRGRSVLSQVLARILPGGVQADERREAA